MIPEGFRRLSWQAAFIAALILLFVGLSDPGKITGGEPIFALIVVGALAFGLVRLIGWIVAGFGRK